MKQPLKVYSIRLSPEHIKFIKKEAKRLDVSVSRYIRMIIEEQLGFIVEND